jgi:hypothetical protein
MTVAARAMAPSRTARSAAGDRVAGPVQRIGEPAGGPVFLPGGLGVGVDAVAKVEQLAGGGADPGPGLVCGGHWSPGTP